MKLRILSTLVFAAVAPPIYAQNLSSLPFLKDYTAERISSYDRSGANADGRISAELESMDGICAVLDTKSHCRDG